MLGNDSTPTMVVVESLTLARIPLAFVAKTFVIDITIKSIRCHVQYQEGTIIW